MRDLSLERPLPMVTADVCARAGPHPTAVSILQMLRGSGRREGRNWWTAGKERQGKKGVRTPEYHCKGREKHPGTAKHQIKETKLADHEPP